MITKGQIVTGAYKYLAMIGLLVSVTPSDIEDGLEVLDDYMGELENEGILMGYAFPKQYGQSTASNDSGLVDWMGGAAKKLLAVQICDFKGLAPTPNLQNNAERAKTALIHATVETVPMQFPDTLPIGSGNENDSGYYEDKFFPDEQEYLFTETDGTFEDLLVEFENAPISYNS